MGGWAGPLQTIFKRPSTKKWLECLRKALEKQGKAKKARASDQKTVCRTPVPTTLKMSSAWPRAPAMSPKAPSPGGCGQGKASAPSKFFYGHQGPGAQWPQKSFFKSLAQKQKTKHFSFNKPVRMKMKSRSAHMCIRLILVRCQAWSAEHA